jgi:hypothetical protein
VGITDDTDDGVGGLNVAVSSDVQHGAAERILGAPERPGHALVHDSFTLVLRVELRELSVWLISAPPASAARLQPA